MCGCSFKSDCVYGSWLLDDVENPFADSFFIPPPTSGSQKTHSAHLCLGEVLKGDSPILRSCGLDWLLITSTAHLAATTCWTALILILPHFPGRVLPVSGLVSAWCRSTRTPVGKGKDIEQLKVLRSSNYMCSTVYLGKRSHFSPTCHFWRQGFEFLIFLHCHHYLFDFYQGVATGGLTGMM